MKIDNVSENTKTVLEKLSKEKFINQYTLVGDTALAIQTGHRLSEDLDFIFDGEYLDTDSIKKFIQKFFKEEYKLIKEENDHQLDFVINGVKVTFFTNASVNIAFAIKEYSNKFNFLNIATIEIISIMKLNAISQRNTIRDYYDLYYIAKYEIPLGNIYSKSRKLLSHLADITYSETIIYVDDLEEVEISDHLMPKENVSKYEIADYFTKEIKKYYNPKIKPKKEN